MTEDDGDVQIRRNSMSISLGALTLAVGLCVSMGAGAAERSSPSDASELSTLVATGDALPDGTMEKPTATGLHLPAFVDNDQGAGPRIQLWDELRIGSQVPPGTSGIIAGGPLK
jgi:hypothetical protein